MSYGIYGPANQCRCFSASRLSQDQDGRLLIPGVQTQCSIFPRDAQRDGKSQVVKGSEACLTEGEIFLIRRPNITQTGT